MAHQSKIGEQFLLIEESWIWVEIDQIASYVSEKKLDPDPTL